MNEPHSINWGAVLAFIAILEFLRSLVIYMFISPLRGAGKKIDHLEDQLNGLNFIHLQKSVEDHEKRMRTLESDAMPIDDFQRYVDIAERDRRLMNKKLDILLQRTAHLRKPEDERELADET
jgi:hypothetical protein